MFQVCSQKYRMIFFNFYFHIYLLGKFGYIFLLWIIAILAISQIWHDKTKCCRESPIPVWKPPHWEVGYRMTSSKCRCEHTRTSPTSSALLVAWLALSRFCCTKGLHRGGPYSKLSKVILARRWRWQNATAMPEVLFFSIFVRYQ
jgi:hypothetical protein